MRIGVHLAVVVALGLASTSAGAEEPPVPTAAQLEAMSEEDLNKGFKAATEVRDNPFEMHCRMAPYVAEYHRRRGTPQLEYALSLSQGFCAFGNDRHGEAIAAMQRSEALAPDDTVPELRMTFDSLLVRSALLGKDKATLEVHALHIARRNWPDEFGGLDAKMWPFVLRDLDLPSSDRVALEFARASAFANLPKDLQGMIGYLAVRPALAAGEGDLATRLALLDPDAYSTLGMLIDRDYAAIWPQLATAAGPNMRLMLASQLADARSEAGADPDNHEKQAKLANALLFNGDPASVVALAAKVDQSSGGIVKIDQDQGWVLNASVKALDRLGRRAEADTVFERLGTLSPEPERGWVVNFAINRADRLVSQGRWAEALPAGELAVAVAAKHGSPYAKEIAAADRYCAAVKLDPDRHGLEEWWTDIEKNWAENVSAAIQAARCKGDDARARQFIRDGLENPKTRPTMLRELQKREFSLFRDSANIFDESRNLLEGDAKLKALYLKYGRDLPDALMPS